MKTSNKRLYRKLLSTGLLVLIILSFNGCKKQDNSYNSTSSGGSGGSGTPPANEVWIQGVAFSPASITVAVNTTVKWTNKDGVTHTVTANNGEFNSGNMSSSGTFSFTFTAAGTFPYHCTIHPGMTGTVTVH